MIKEFWLTIIGATVFGVITIVVAAVIFRALDSLLVEDLAGMISVFLAPALLGLLIELAYQFTIRIERRQR